MRVGRAVRRSGLLPSVGALLALACGGGAPGGERAAPPGDVSVEGAFAHAPPASGEVAVYFTVANAAAAPDTLVHVTTPEAAGVMFHRNVTDGGLVRMEHVETLVVPGRGRLVLEPGGLHLMLTSVRPRSPGDTIHLGLQFAHGGMRTVAVVIREPGL